MLFLILYTSQTMLNLHSYRELPFQLSEIYHFHLHPEDKPDKIKAKFQYYTNVDTRLRNSSVVLRIEAPLVCPYIVCINDRPEMNIEDLKESASPVALSIKAAKSLFRFRLTLPDPSPLEDTHIGRSTQRNAVEVSLTQRGAAEVSPDACIEVEGMMFYYPYDQGQVLPYMEYTTPIPPYTPLYPPILPYTLLYSPIHPIHSCTPHQQETRPIESYNPGIIQQWVSNFNGEEV